jgi:hypothetical protein
MSQRDYEQQPEAPDLGEYVQENVGETLVGPTDSDPLDAGYVPPDRPYLSEDEASQTRARESLDQRLRRERPDVGESGYRNDAEPDRAPRLEADQVAPDTWGTEDTDALGVGISGGAASAEEAAVHEVSRGPLAERPDTDAELRGRGR